MGSGDREYLWTWGGTFFGYREGDELWTHDGRHVGRFEKDDVYGSRGGYLGETAGENRLIMNLSKRSRIKGEFASFAPRMAMVPYVDYVGYVMYVGYEDFPAPQLL